MTFKQHLISAVPLSLGLGLVSGSAQAGIIAGLTTVLIDVDHVFDYIVSHGRFRSLKHMFQYCYEGRITRHFLLAHSYEFWLAAALLLPGRLPHVWTLGFLTGWLVHIFFDQMINPARPLTYFFLYRLRVGFRKERIGTPRRNLYTDLALKLGLPRPDWTRPRAKAER